MVLKINLNNVVLYVFELYLVKYVFGPHEILEISVKHLKKKNFRN